MSAHTQGEARLATQEDPGFAEDMYDCVVMVGNRQILECYEDGEAQTSEDAANAARIVKAWNAYPKLVEALRTLAAHYETRPDVRSRNGALIGASDGSLAANLKSAATLLRELGEAP